MYINKERLKLKRCSVKFDLFQKIENREWSINCVDENTHHFRMRDQAQDRRGDLCPEIGQQSPGVRVTTCSRRAHGHDQLLNVNGPQLWRMLMYVFILTSMQKPSWWYKEIIRNSKLERELFLHFMQNLWDLWWTVMRLETQDALKFNFAPRWPLFLGYKRCTNLAQDEDVEQGRHVDDRGLWLLGKAGQDALDVVSDAVRRVEGQRLARNAGKRRGNESRRRRSAHVVESTQQ